MNSVAGQALLKLLRRAENASGRSEDGRNIGDLDVLVDIARDSGLDGDALRQALTERRYADLVDEGIQWAAESGLTSTPTFVFDDRLAIVGAQEYDLFESVMERLGVKRRTMNDE